MVSRHRPYDIGVIGATGFTGRLVLQRLCRNQPNLRVLASSRNPEALQSLIRSLNLPWIIAWGHPVSSESFDDLAGFVSLVKVVIACAGPFFDVGMPVARACVQRGTHYVDICAEVDFIRQVIDELGMEARAKGVVLVPACGFNGLADMGVLFGQQLAQSPVIRVLNVVSMQSSLSGGSLKTLFSVASNERRWSEMRDAYALNERRDPEHAPGSKPTEYDSDVFAVKYDSSRGKWTCPSGTAPVNSRIVRRTASLSRLHPERGFNLHRKFEYRELHASDSFLSAMVPATLAMLQSPVKWALSLPLINRIRGMLLPQAKEESGPDEGTRKQNWFRFHIECETDTQEQVRVDVYGGDFYDVTAESVAQAAICILEEHVQILQDTQGGGIFTPAFALGQRYLERLKTSPLLKFERSQAESAVPAG